MSPGRVRTAKTAPVSRERPLGEAGHLAAAGTPPRPAFPTSLRVTVSKTLPARAEFSSPVAKAAPARTPLRELPPARPCGPASPHTLGLGRAGPSADCPPPTSLPENDPPFTPSSHHAEPLTPLPPSCAPPSHPRGAPPPTPEGLLPYSLCSAPPCPAQYPAKCQAGRLPRTPCQVPFKAWLILTGPVLEDAPPTPIPCLPGCLSVLTEGRLALPTAHWTVQSRSLPEPGALPAETPEHGDQPSPGWQHHGHGLPAQNQSSACFCGKGSGGWSPGAEEARRVDSLPENLPWTQAGNLPGATITP